MRQVAITFCFALLGTSLACATHTVPRVVLATQSAPFQISMQVELHPKLEVGKRSLMPGETANTGDGFGIKVWADRPVYLYLISFSKTGWSRRLFPDSGDELVQAGEKLFVPRSGNLYRLHDPPEENILYLFASEHPIDDASCATLRLSCVLEPTVASSRGGDSDKKEPPPPPPPPPPSIGKTAIEREGALVIDAKERFVSVNSEGKGTALLRFSFHQKP